MFKISRKRGLSPEIPDTLNIFEHVLSAQIQYLRAYNPKFNAGNFSESLI